VSAAQEAATSAEAWRLAANILCVRLDNMGDVLMCTPAMRALLQARPGRKLTLLASPAGAAAVPYIPELQAVLPYAAPWMKGAAGSADPSRMLRLLRGGGYDAAVIFTSFSQSALPAALLCHQAGIPLRLAHCRENPYHLLTDWVPDPEPEQGIRHEVRRQLALAASISCHPEHERLSFATRPADLAWMRRRLKLAGVAPDRPWLLMHPGATAASRRYPAGLWSHVIRRAAGELGLPVLLTGERGDAALIASIIDAAAVPVSAPAVSSLAGELDLGRLGAAIALASVVVSNNTGPAHMAAALGTPLVDLYALTNPQHTPWRVESRVLFNDVPCRYCYKSQCPQGHQLCLAGVEPERVLAAVRSLLERPGPGRTEDAVPRPGAL
jgi:lipopolysaccharide heptosyltransferase II